METLQISSQRTKIDKSDNYYYYLFTHTNTYTHINTHTAIRIYNHIPFLIFNKVRITYTLE